jgi:hypothetical protein
MLPRGTLFRGSPTEPPQSVMLDEDVGNWTFVERIDV